MARVAQVIWDVFQAWLLYLAELELEHTGCFDESNDSDLSKQFFIRTAL